MWRGNHQSLRRSRVEDLRRRLRNFYGNEHLVRIEVVLAGLVDDAALELIREKHPGARRELTLFRPVLLDELAEKRVQSPDTGYDVPRFPRL